MWGPEIRGFDGHFLLKRPSETFLGTPQWVPLQILYDINIYLQIPFIYRQFSKSQMVLREIISHIEARTRNKLLID